MWRPDTGFTQRPSCARFRSPEPVFSTQRINAGSRTGSGTGSHPKGWGTGNRSRDRFSKSVPGTGGNRWEPGTGSDAAAPLRLSALPKTRSLSLRKR